MRKLKIVEHISMDGFRLPCPEKADISTEHSRVHRVPHTTR